MAESPLIAIDDDDASIRDALTSLLRAAGWQVKDFAAAGTLLESGQVHTTACLLLDARLPGGSGLERQRQVGRDRAHLPGMCMLVCGHEARRALALHAGDTDLRQILRGHRIAGSFSCRSRTSVWWHMGLHC
jgi:two-component system, chemotaxis family, CheB/CheR fusion protein